MQLTRFLSLSGIASRRKAEQLIAKGFVTVNNTLRKEPGVVVDPEHDIVHYRGKAIRPESFVYYAVHKPIGMVSTVRDSHAKQKVIDLVPKEPRVYPVGRLDKDSSGLLLLTNDGDLTYQLTHPKFGAEKEYHITVGEPLTPKALRKLMDGVALKEEKVAADRVEQLGDHTLLMTLHEGKNRQIRRMLGRIGFTVSQLVRVREGKVKLGKLAPGEFRELRREDIL